MYVRQYVGNILAHAYMGYRSSIISKNNPRLINNLKMINAEAKEEVSPSNDLFNDVFKKV